MVILITVVIWIVVAIQPLVNNTDSHTMPILKEDLNNSLPLRCTMAVLRPSVDMAVLGPNNLSCLMLKVSIPLTLVHLFNLHRASFQVNR